MRNIVKSIDAASAVIDSLQGDIQGILINQSNINTKLQNALYQVHCLAQSVRGDGGLVSRVAVLESRLTSLDDQIKNSGENQRALKSHNVSLWAVLLSAAALIVTIVVATTAKSCQAATPVVNSARIAGE